MKSFKHKLIYLASPYSHKSVQVRLARAKEVSKIAASLIKSGHVIYCPIAETVSIAKYGQLKDTDWDFWRINDSTKLMKCDELWVATMDGWKESKGVQGEIKLALKNKIPIKFLYHDTLVYEIPVKIILKHFNVNKVSELND